MRKAVVRIGDDLVTNVIEIEEGANWTIPSGYYLVDAIDDGSPGDSWDGTKFIKPKIADYDTLKAKVEAL